jgi:regulator of protease activity HflC (stomatin/prohibitin superfamily)
MDFEFTTTTSVLLCFGFACILLISCYIGVSPETEIIVLQRFGNITRQIKGGGIFLFRPFENIKSFAWSWNGKDISVRQSLPLMEQVLDPPALSVRAKRYPCHVDILVRYRITDPIKASKTSNDPLLAVMVNAKSHLRGVISNYEWKEVQQERDRIANELHQHINQTTEDKYGITVCEVIIEKICVSPEIERTFQAGAKLDSEIENTKKRRDLQLFEEKTKTQILHEDLDRQRLQYLSDANNLSEELDRLNKSGVDVSNYLLTKSFDKFSEALSHSNVTTLVLNIDKNSISGHQPLILNPTLSN